MKVEESNAAARKLKHVTYLILVIYVMKRFSVFGLWSCFEIEISKCYYLQNICLLEVFALTVNMSVAFVTVLNESKS